jgi:hypothetical protein
MQHVRFLVFDFDGTALGGHEPYAMFPPPFAAFLNGLGARGVQWATNTTWGVEAQGEVLRRSGVTATPVFLCGQTGRQLAQMVGGEVTLDADHEVALEYQDHAFHERLWPRVREVFLALLEADVVSRLGYDSISPQRIIDFTARVGQGPRLWELLAPLLGPEDYYPFNPRRGEMGALLPAHMNKGAIVRTMQVRLNVPPEQTVVAGDAFNDLPMFDPALCGGMVCPSNADELLRERVEAHGGVIAESAYSWGVVEGVERLLAECGQ